MRHTIKRIKHSPRNGHVNNMLICLEPNVLLDQRLDPNF